MPNMAPVYGADYPLPVLRSVEVEHLTKLKTTKKLPITITFSVTSLIRSNRAHLADANLVAGIIHMLIYRDFEWPMLRVSCVFCLLMTLLRQSTASLSSTASPIDTEGLHARHGHRSRKQSLSDSVPVDRIAATNRQEPFKDATSNINNEMRQKRHPHEE